MNEHIRLPRRTNAEHTRTRRLPRALLGLALLLAACAGAGEQSDNAPEGSADTATAGSRSPWKDIARQLGMPANATEREMAAKLTERVASTQKQLKDRARTAQPEVEQAPPENRVSRDDPVPRPRAIPSPMPESSAAEPGMHMAEP